MTHGRFADVAAAHGTKGGDVGGGGGSSGDDGGRGQGQSETEARP